jgi:hypothetical protein
LNSSRLAGERLAGLVIDKLLSLQSKNFLESF